MQVEEVRNHRDLVYEKVLRMADRVKAGMESRNHRAVKNSLNELTILFDKFEQLHVAYATKAKLPLDNAALKEIYDACETAQAEADEAGRGFLEDHEAGKEQQRLDEFNRKERADRDQKRAVLVRDFERSVEQLASHMERLATRMQSEDGDAWRPEPAVLAGEAAYCEDKFKEAQAHMDEAVELTAGDEDITAMRTRLGQEEYKFRERLIRIKSYAWLPDSNASSQPFSRPASRRSSPDRDVEKFKAVRVDYPKFSGDVRQYLTFKRDFEEVVKRPGRYTDSEMSLILRNNCLEGQVKLDYQNLTDFKKLEEKLDDEYLDKEKVVDMITTQLTEFRAVGYNDYAAFIELVNTVEMAHLDMEAVGNTNTLNNPMTVRLIESKCPDWVQKALMTAKEEGVGEGQEFTFLLQFLEKKRKEARRLLRLKESQPLAASKPAAQSFQLTQQKKKGGAAHATAGQQAGGSGAGPGGGPGGGQQQGGASGQKSFVCVVTDCKYKQKHMLSDCRAFKRLDCNMKGQLVVDKALCVLCFGKSHKAADCPKKTTGWRPCDTNNCGRWHSRLLHGATTPGLALAILTTGGPGGPLPVILLTQWIPVKDGPPCATLWDHGSTTALVTFDYARRAALQGVDCSFELTVVGEKADTFATKLFVITLLDQQGAPHEVCAFGIERITADIQAVYVDQALPIFSSINKDDIEMVVGAVDLLVGISHADLLPVQIELVDKLAVYTSLFGTGFLVGGTGETLKAPSVWAEAAHSISHQEARSLRSVDFLSAEAFGVEIPKRCKMCNNCKECSFKASSLTWVENQELQEIEKGLTLDTVEKKWTAVYPFKEDPSVMKDNYRQALACMEKTEKRLLKLGQLADFNQQFKESIDRGVFKELGPEEINCYEGPINYITIVETFKPGPLSTTPIRLCMNSSMKYAGVSLNDLLMKGPPALNDLFGVTVGFRKHKVGFTKDLSKFYQSVRSCERDQHLRRVLWRWGDASKEPSIYVTTSVNFGDKPAGCVAQTAVRETARLYRHIHPEAADMITKATYVDDTLGGADNREEAVLLSAGMDKIVAMGGFCYKSTVMSGDREEESGGCRKVLGICWNTEGDTLSIDVKVNTTCKRKGVRKEADLDLAEVPLLLPETVTKRMVWRIVLGQYDLLGLVSVFTIQLKLIMRELSGEVGKAMGWDQPIPEVVRSRFISTLDNMHALRELAFPRCVVPKGADSSIPPDLLCFADGSTTAFCALVYGRWKLTGGGFACSLIAGKTRVAPLKKISVPRMELLGALAGVRLASNIEEHIGINFGRRFFFTDSSAVLGMIRGESASMMEFVGTRTSEIKSKSEPESEWFWLPTDKNLADMGTRTAVRPDDMGPHSEYQSGMDWMREEVVRWPINQSFGRIPEEEFSKTALLHATCSKESFISYGRFSTFDKLVRVFGYVYQFIENIRRKMISGGILENNAVAGRFFLSRGNILTAENFILASAQENLRGQVEAGKYNSLLPRVVGFKDERGMDVEHVVVSGRLAGLLQVGYDKQELPLLEASHPLSRLIIRGAHEIDHGGLERTVQRSRNTAWIVKARSVAKSVRSSCFKCKIREKVLQKQIMAPLPASRVSPAPVFNSTAVDLFGPLLIRDTVKGRVTKKCWGVIFCCTVTSAVHLEVSEDYSCDSFLLCLRRFLNMRGTPSRFQSDPGDQLMAAAVELGKWDFSRILEWCSGKKTEWHFAPAGAQHFNGTAEAMIRVTKRQLTDILKGRHCTKGELDVIMSDVAVIVNSRPLMVKAGTDPWSGGPITPLHLLGGRATIDVPRVEFDGKAGLTKRLRFLEELKNQFWRKWFPQVFHHLVPCKKWKKEFRNIMVGDIVLWKENNPLQPTYNLARVKSVVPGEDGKVRRVRLEYKNVGPGTDLQGAKFRETERSIHSLVVIVPADWKEEDCEEAVHQGRQEKLES